MFVVGSVFAAGSLHWAEHSVLKPRLGMGAPWTRACFTGTRRLLSDALLEDYLLMLDEL